MLVGMIFRNEIQYCFMIDNILENHIFCRKDKTKEVSMNIVFKIYDLKEKKEIMFDKNNIEEVIGIIREEEGSILKKITLHDCFKVFLDKEKGYRFEINEKLLNHLGFSLEFEVVNFHRLANLEEYDFENDEIEITKEEFVNTLINNYEIFKKAKMNDGRYWNYPVENYFCYKRKI